MSNTTVGMMLRGLFGATKAKAIYWLDGSSDGFDGAWNDISDAAKEHWRSLAELAQDAFRASIRTPTHAEGKILQDIYNERRRQEQLKTEGRFAYTCADSEMTNPERLTVLGEEFGEVSHEVNEGIGINREVNIHKLRKELVQVAAVCMSWIEVLDAYLEKQGP